MPASHPVSRTADSVRGHASTAWRPPASYWPPTPAPRPKIIILTTFDLDEYVYDALVAGACGFLLKDVRANQLVAGIRTAATGEALLSPAITQRLITRFVERPATASAPPGMHDLTGLFSAA